MNQYSDFLNRTMRLAFSLLFTSLVVLSCDKNECERKNCKDAIPLYYDPVCGCDDATYSNPEEAECHGIENYTKGVCEKECEEKTCEGGYIEIYDPVCGCNGATYSNSAEAECKGITSYTQGECED
ncbi:MAG: hypothetical protein CMP67_10160 [Flavobacteriales bacterium]|nr:hypothetical protein [Flavobacteriales bacterium]MBL56296.1 hypothetical protein [Flavobacteriales bacterium]